jgi:hypothetical protein
MAGSRSRGREEASVYAFTQDVPIDEDRYRKIIELIGPEPMEGLLLHLCVRRPEGGLRYIEVWESQQACARVFHERIHPAVDAAFGGARPGTEPVPHPLDVVHATGPLFDRAGS